MHPPWLPSTSWAISVIPQATRRPSTSPQEENISCISTVAESPSTQRRASSESPPQEQASGRPPTASDATRGCKGSFAKSTRGTARPRRSAQNSFAGEISAEEFCLFESLFKILKNFRRGVVPLKTPSPPSSSPLRGSKPTRPYGEPHPRGRNSAGAAWAGALRGGRQSVPA